MSKRIEINIPGYGKKYCSDNVKYHIENDYFYFYYSDKDGYKIYHNEYGPAKEWKDGSYQYFVNDKLHRLDGPTFYDMEIDKKQYWINDKLIGNTEEEFIEYKNKYLLE